MEQLVKGILAKENVRSNLSELRKIIKDPEEKKRLDEMIAEHKELIVSFLDSDDAKTRKNAALLLGDLGWDDTQDEVYRAYQKEDTLFVRSSYLAALSGMYIESKLPLLKEQLERLQEEEVPAEKRKHVDEEIREIRKLLIKYEGITKHSFYPMSGEKEVLLICNKNHREIVKRAIDNRTAKVHPLGVMVKTDDLRTLDKVRVYREMVFPIHAGGFLPGNPKDAAELLWKSDFYELLTSMHNEKGPFYYRIELKSPMSLEDRSDFSKKLGSALEKLSGGMLVNSAGDYEFELRLISTKEGKFYPCLKLFTRPDRRFKYRKNWISASINPSTAALIVEMAKPYLMEDAQIMDPFCGVGTMLIERDKAVPAREIYATDIFGEAIEKARENSILAGKQNINYIHRDFFDFKHGYKFDEIITNMPVKGKRTKDELDKLYSDFFDKAKEILTEKGIVIMYTNEPGLVKKQLRLHKDFTMLQETCMQSKTEFYLLVIGVKG